MNLSKRLTIFAIASLAVIGLFAYGVHQKSTTGQDFTAGDTQETLPVFKSVGNAILPRVATKDFALGSSTATASAPLSWDNGANLLKTVNLTVSGTCTGCGGGSAFTGLLMGEGSTTATHITQLTYDANALKFSPTASAGILTVDYGANGVPSRSFSNTWSALNTFSAGASFSLSIEVSGTASVSGTAQFSGPIIMPMETVGASGGFQIYNTAQEPNNFGGNGNYEALKFYYSGNTATINSMAAGSGTTARSLQFVQGSSSLVSATLNGSASSASGLFAVNRSTGGTNHNVFAVTGTNTATSGKIAGIANVQNINQSSTAGYDGYFENLIIQTHGSGRQNLVRFQGNTQDRFAVDINGLMTVTASPSKNAQINLVPVSSAGTDGSFSIIASGQTTFDRLMVKSSDGSVKVGIASTSSATLLSSPDAFRSGAGIMYVNGAIESHANNGVNFVIGDDSTINDANLANSLGIRGQTTTTEGGARFGSSGGYIYGTGTGIGINILSTPNKPDAMLDVSGNILASVSAGNVDIYMSGAGSGTNESKMIWRIPSATERLDLVDNGANTLFSIASAGGPSNGSVCIGQQCTHTSTDPLMKVNGALWGNPGAVGAGFYAAGRFTVFGTDFTSGGLIMQDVLEPAFRFAGATTGAGGGFSEKGRFLPTTGQWMFGTTTNNGSEVTVASTSNPLSIKTASSSSDPHNYQMLIWNPTSVVASASGISFMVSSAGGRNIGAAIIHQRTAGASVGTLEFWTKNNQSAGMGPQRRMVIGADGRVQIGGGLTPTALLGLASASIGDSTILNVNGNTTTTSNVASISAMTLTTGSALRINVAANGSGQALLVRDTNNKNIASISAIGNVEFAGTASISGRVWMPGLTTAAGFQTADLCTGAAGEVIADSVLCLASSKRFKENIKPLDAGLDEIMKLKPVSYYYTPEFNRGFQSNPNYNGEQVGFIAEDVNDVDPRFITVETSGKFDGQPHSVRYEQLVAPMVKAIQEQQAEIEELQKKVNGPVQTKGIPSWAVIGLAILGGAVAGRLGKR